MTHALLRRIAVGSGALTIALTTALTGVAAADETPTSGTSSAQQHADQPAPKFDLTTKFDKANYNSGDTVTGSITITNTGSDTTRVRLVAVPTNLQWQIKDADSIWLSGPGVDVAPGATEVRTFTGTIVDPSKPISAVAILRIYEPVDTTFRATASATVTPTRGGIVGTLYGDANGNGKYDQGEGLDGVQVTITGGVPSKTLPAVKTDGDGKFAFPDIPSGRYTATFDGAKGYVLPAVTWQVDDKPLQVSVPARRPVSDTLTATTKLTADTYKVGDLAHVTVTMKNSGDQPLTGIGVRCNRIGDANELSGRTDGWGDLRDDRSGVTVPAHGTITMDVSEAVPAGARGFGFVTVACDFGQFKDGIEDGVVHANPDRAHVPGAIANIDGALANVKTDAVPAGVKLYLVDEISGKPAANTVTDAKGGFKFTGLPAGLYRTVLVGPWKLTAEQSPTWIFPEGDSHGRDIAVEPGPDQADPYPPTTAPTAPTTPAPQAMPPLANTGATDVLAMTGAALGALVVGVGLVLLSRRRRTS